jgi:uncharacterized cupredoxin-like copper-binding protein
VTQHFVTLITNLWRAKENHKMKRLIIIGSLALSVLLLVACAGAESSAPESVTLDFTGFDEFRFDPETATVKASAQVTINFQNEGVLEHNWMLASNNIELTEADEDDALGGAISGLVPGGGSKTFTFTAPPVGTYKILCTVPGHAAAGMVAEFKVVP